MLGQMCAVELADAVAEGCARRPGWPESFRLEDGHGSGCRLSEVVLARSCKIICNQSVQPEDECPYCSTLLSRQLIGIDEDWSKVPEARRKNFTFKKADHGRKLFRNISKACRPVNNRTSGCSSQAQHTRSELIVACSYSGGGRKQFYNLSPLQ